LNIIKVDGIARACNPYNREEKSIENFSQNFERKRPLERPRHEGSFKIYLREIL
jgi:hypothetical protein